MAVAKYELLEVIAKGSHGTVYRGLDLENKREVAIKKVLRTQFHLKEIEKHKIVNHLSIVPKFYDTFTEITGDGSYIYIVTELIHGQTLHDSWIENKNWDFVWLTLFHVLKAIKEFQSIGIAHRDANSGNFIWTGDKLYIIDFDRIIQVKLEIENRLRKLEIRNRNMDLILNFVIRNQDPFYYDLPFEILDEIQDIKEQYLQGRSIKDIFDDGNEEINRLKQEYCFDYMMIYYSLKRIVDDTTESWSNSNMGLERISLLHHDKENFLCEKINPTTREYQSVDDYYDQILHRYLEIDSFVPEILISQLGRKSLFNARR
jgi:predicted Ser/Thr protein kinase